MKKIKVLIVDDYKENILALSELIANDEIEVHSATNAENALELISRHDFGLALFDVQMPGTDGFELATIVRGVERFKNTPIIFVTAHSQDSSFAYNGYQTGAVGLLYKPLDPHIVRAKVRTFVEMAKQRRLLQEQVEELERLRKEAHSANLAKSRFLANMSHEIRTPLAAVMGFAELATNPNTNETEKQQCAQAVQRNGELLMRLIDDILDLSKIEANKLSLEKQSFNLKDLIHDVGSTLSFRAKEKGVTFDVSSIHFTHDYFESDPARLKQVLLNIIGNAIKFTGQGGEVQVEFKLAPLPGAEKSHRLTVTVKDNGIGLTREQMSLLFQPFSQADASTKRKFGGSGLGLTISREIARSTGGDLKILSSEVGVGTTFEIEFILHAIATPACQDMRPTLASAQDLSALNGMKVLAIDDSPDNLTLLAYYLKNTGVDVSYAENAAKGIELAGENDFDVILMDIQMPEMDGHQATEIVRQNGFTKPILALTAHVLRDEHEKCLSSGCNDVLTKPLSRTKLIKKLIGLRESSEQTEAEPLPLDKKTFKKSLHLEMLSH